MTTPRFWDSNTQQQYVQGRDALTERQAQWREGKQHAENPKALWNSLAPEEQNLLQWLLINETPSLVGRCDDPVLKRMMSLGVLHWPPGVRPVLTDDLITTFHIGPALWSVMLASRADWFAGTEEVNALKVSLHQRFSDRWVVLSDEGQPAPLAIRPPT
jgi:hypothetical protein